LSAVKSEQKKWIDIFLENTRFRGNLVLWMVTYHITGAALRCHRIRTFAELGVFLFIILTRKKKLLAG
jgi:hypothetical protein